VRSGHEEAVSFFDAERAREYDERSQFDKGDRDRHKELLSDLLCYLARDVAGFTELGCGSGFHTEVLLDHYPTARGLLIDSSDAMLGLARARLAGRDGRMTYCLGSLDEVTFTSEGVAPDVVFSGLTLSFLPDAVRERTIRRVHGALADGGVFVLFDQYRPAEPRHADAVEYLACRDMQRRLARHFGLPPAAPALEIGRLRAAERQARLDAGLTETSVEEHLRLLGDAGFEAAHTLFVDPRLFGIVAHKAGGGHS
jgi:SAM-dependent methyltransferase